ncbi:synembryn [Skeletonema marinoi]|uniref:Synembryn n=1 Tax=Skeletonema marinoi TaxID=267567 RepID=A0AAD8YLQ1_9STRA|nr:synembryn [Skeletonema marinoi]
MAEVILERLVQTLEKDAPPQEQSLKEWNNDLEQEMLSGGGSQFVTTNDDSSEQFSALNSAADRLHTSLLAVVSPGYVGNGDDSNEVADEVANEIQIDVNNQNVSFLSEILRAAGLFMRWYGQCLQSSLESVSNSAANPTARLKSKGMLLLYCKLLDDATLQSSNECPDIPRFASVCIFRATYGNDVVTASARKSFVHSIDGCTYLMRTLLKGDQPVPRIFSVVRNVHHLISAAPESIPKMEKTLEALTAEEFSVETEDGNDKKKYGLLEVLVATLAWALRSDPPFPGDPADRRSDLALEILRSLFAMDAGKPSMPLPSNDTMTQIGMMLSEILRLSNADVRVYQCKLAVVTLLLNAPGEYSGYLASHDGIKPLVNIMAYQLSTVVVERTANSAEDAAAVVPILLVLRKLCQSNSAVLQMVKNEVFPPELEDRFAEKGAAEMAKMQSDGQSKAKNMAPLDAPRGTVRWKLIRLMTWIDSSVKRSACELLWTLCHEDATEFVLRTGFGNAVYFLGNKGLVNMPAGVNV